MAARAEGKPSTFALKICLAGETAVGKTSLLYRFVSNTFDKRYVTTLGVKVSSRRFTVEDPTRPGFEREVDASLWDIMGQGSFREVFKEAYFKGAQGVLLVCDSTRPETLRTLPAWYNAVRAVAGPVPAVVLLNKSDLADQARMDRQEVEGLCREKGWSWLRTSALTGENVEEGFRVLAKQCLQRLAEEAGPATVAANPGA